MNPVIFSEYAQICKEISALEEKKRAYGKSILMNLEEEKAKTKETVYGKFTRAERKSYKYSKAVKNLEEEVKILKINEQESGVAKEEVSTYLTFTAPKEVDPFATNNGKGSNVPVGESGE